MPDKSIQVCMFTEDCLYKKSVSIADYPEVGDKIAFWTDDDTLGIGMTVKERMWSTKGHPRKHDMRIVVRETNPKVYKLEELGWEKVENPK